MHIIEKAPKVRIVRMRQVYSIDATGLNMVKDMLADCRKSGTTFIFMRLMTGFCHSIPNGILYLKFD
jgi:SulP family sulfate permease